MVLNLPLICCLGLPDASLQAGSGHAVMYHISRPEGSVPLLQQGLDVFCHPGFLVLIHPDAPVHSDSVNTMLDVAENDVGVLFQVLIFENGPVGISKTVLQLLCGIIRQGFNGFLTAFFLIVVYAVIRSRDM